ncbi:MAG: hypothetical protein AB8H79_10525 [Myxococcota bacterium]
MRTLSLAFLALGTVACSGDAVHLEYQSTLWNETSGVVMHDDTARGHGSMLETTCEFDMSSGAVTGDVDLPTAGEVVSDVVDGAVLAHTSAGLHIIRGLEWDPNEDIALGGVVDAAFSGDGPVALVQGDSSCSVVWTDSDLSVDVGACGPNAELLADPSNGVAFLADGGLVSRVDVDGLTELAAGDAVAFNPTTGMLFVASGDKLAQLDATGAELWSTGLSDTIYDMTDLGARGGVAVVTSDRSLQIIGEDGGVRSTNALPASAKVVSNNSGRDLSLVLPDQVNFFRVEDGPKRMSVVTNTPVENPFSD